MQPEPPDDPLSDDLKEYRSSTISNIPSLCYVGVASRGGSPILVALLKRDATTEDLGQTINELNNMKTKIQNSVLSEK